MTIHDITEGEKLKTHLYRFIEQIRLTFTSIGVAHIIGGTIRVIVRVGSGSIDSNKLAPVHLKMAGMRRIRVSVSAGGTTGLPDRGSC